MRIMVFRGASRCVTTYFGRRRRWRMEEDLTCDAGVHGAKKDQAAYEGRARWDEKSLSVDAGGAGYCCARSEAGRHNRPHRQGAARGMHSARCMHTPSNEFWARKPSDFSHRPTLPHSTTATSPNPSAHHPTKSSATASPTTDPSKTATSSTSTYLSTTAASTVT